jgi:hypothetical protein
MNKSDVKEAYSMHRRHEKYIQNKFWREQTIKVGQEQMDYINKVDLD